MHVCSLPVPTGQTVVTAYAKLASHTHTASTCVPLWLSLLCFCVLCVLRPSIYFICIGLAVNFCVMYWDRRRVGPPTSRARARVRRLTPTDRYHRDSNPGPLDLKSSILPLSYRPPIVVVGCKLRAPEAENFFDMGSSGSREF